MTVLDEKRPVARQDSDSTTPAYPSADDSSEPLITDGFVVPDLEVDDEAPPAYGDHLDRVQFTQPGFEAGAAVTDNGRININISTKNRRLADLLAPVLENQVSTVESQETLPPAYIPPSLGGSSGEPPPPPLNVVIQIVGSRGDVQPFVALGKTLQDTYGHRVRIATHSNFQQFVEENNLEFFNIGGDPAELMAFMVKHPGLMPGFDALTSGEVSKRRKGIEDIMRGCWRSCIETGNGLGPPPKPHKRNEPLDLAGDIPLDGGHLPFVADAIIANPPSFAHVHLAEKLGIPLHMMFTMPWSPTRAFPHPLANIQSSNVDDVLTNNLSYTLVEMMTWQGLGDIINRFREKVLDLPGLSLIWAPGLLNRLKIPYTYCWSPALIPKPQDWGQNIDIAGFYFLNLASSYTPDPELAAFLEAGPPPVYIGFGSIVVDDPNAMTRMIFDAIHLTGVRALVSKGWGGLGADDVGIPEGVFMLGNVPHDWLFEKVSCVVHHGGAGTTAAGIKAGKPTVVVPFFGDQPFWGAMIAKANAGPEPIAYKDLTAEKLAESIKFCLQEGTIEQASILGGKIREEKGSDVGGTHFHRHLKMDELRCAVAPSRAAVWRVRRTQVRLSALAMAALVKDGHLKYSDVKLYRPCEYNTDDQPPDPISAGASSLVMGLSGMGMAIADMPRGLWKSLKSPKEGQSSKSDKTDTATKTASSTEVSSIISREPTTGSRTTLPEASESQKSLPESSGQVSSPGEVTSEEATAETASPSHPSGKGQPEQLEQTSSANSFNMETAMGAAKGVERFVNTGSKTPMNFCLGLAKGFRNMPRLYNDDTIRPAEKVTDFASGVKVAGKELGFGFFDGISGLVTQPLKGAEKDGAAGLIKGFGKGIGGLVAKPAAGIWGVPAYTMQGVHAEVHRLLSRSVQNYLITSRVQQGQIELSKATTEEQADIIKRWNNLKWDLQNFYQLKRKGKGKDIEKASTAASEEKVKDKGFEKPRTGWLHTRHLSYEQRKKLHAEKEAWKRGYVEADVEKSGGASAPGQSTEDAEVEQAIQASIRETSRGNPEEDAAIEMAMRESIRAMQAQGTAVPGTASGYPPQKDPSIFEDDEYKITDEQYQELVEQAIRQSLADSQRQSYSTIDHNATIASGTESDPSGASNKSATVPDLPPRATADDDDELQHAIAASKEDMERVKSEKTEEDIVLEYVKKQSLAEEAFRSQSNKGKASAADEEDDEDLRRAMEESLTLCGGNTNSGPAGAGGST